MSRPKFHLSEYLTEEYITKIKTDHNFRHADIVEKFLMDFEVLFHIQQEIECIVKGEMAVPFHINDRSARRLSEDIDFVTNVPGEQVITKMEKIKQQVKSLDLRVELHPRQAITTPLISYDVYYPSVFKTEGNIKVDIIHSFDINKLSIKRITSNSEVLSFSPNYNIQIFSTGSLIGDKITTLAEGTIGIPSAGIRTNDIAKQIYDIAMLLRHSDTHELETIPTAYQATCEFQRREDKNYSDEEIADHIFRFVKSLIKLDRNGYELIQIEQNRYHNFRGQLLSSHGYTITEHKDDILLIVLFGSLLQLLIKNKVTPSTFASELFSAIEELKKIKRMTGKERNEHRQVTLGTIKQIDHNRRHLERAIPEHILLYKKISDARMKL